MDTLRSYPYPQFGLLATAKVYMVGSGFTADVWWSIQSDDTARVIMHMQVPVFGESPSQAITSAGRLVAGMAPLVPSLWGGEGVPSEEAPTSGHVDAHLKFHGDLFEKKELRPVEDVAAMYKLLADFRVKNPAKRIATYLNVPSTRIVHEYIADARNEGLIPRYGRGRSHE